KVFEQVNEPRSRAIAFQNIGALYSVANDFATAERNYAKAAAIYTGDPALSLALHNSSGNVLTAAGRNAEAGKEYETAVAIARRRDKPVLEALMLSNLARNQVTQQQFAAAERSVARGFELIRGADADLLRRHMLATAAELASQRGDNAAAVRLIRSTFAGLDL